MSRCTWRDCKKEATIPQLDRRGGAWAQLCDKHDKSLQDSIKNGNPDTMVSCWMNAQGGVDAASRK